LKSIEGKELGIEIPHALGSEILKVEELIKKRVCIGHQVSVSKLVEELESFSAKVVEYAIHNMVRNGDLKEMRGRKLLTREK
jgi:hypothetical protein